MGLNPGGDLTQRYTYLGVGHPKGEEEEVFFPQVPPMVG